LRKDSPLTLRFRRDRRQVSVFSAASGQTNDRSNRKKKLCQIGKLSHKRIRRFVLVLVLVLEALNRIQYRGRAGVRRRARFRHPIWGLKSVKFHTSGGLRLKDSRSDR